MSANVSIFLINWLVSYVDGLQHSRGEKHAQHCVLPWSRHISQTAPFPPRHLGPALSLKSQDASTSEPTTAPSGGGTKAQFHNCHGYDVQCIWVVCWKKFEVFASSAQHGGSLWWDVGMLGRAWLFVKLYSLDSRSLSWIKATSPFRENVFTLHYRWLFLSFEIFINAQLIEKRATLESETNQQKTLVFNTNKIAARYKMSSPQKYWKSVHNRCAR